MDYVFWWFIMGLIGCAIGQMKSRPLAGFIWGLFLGPIGWFIIAIGPNLGPKCPECKGVIVNGATKCKNCGSSIIPKILPESPALLKVNAHTHETDPQKIYENGNCPECGADINKKQDKCTECDAFLVKYM